MVGSLGVAAGRSHIISLVLTTLHGWRAKTGSSGRTRLSGGGHIESRKVASMVSLFGHSTPEFPVVRAPLSRLLDIPHRVPHPRRTGAGDSRMRNPSFGPIALGLLCVGALGPRRPHLLQYPKYLPGSINVSATPCCIVVIQMPVSEA